MGEVVEFERGGAPRAVVTIPHRDPAAIIILPVIRIERNADAWDNLPSDSAPHYCAPDTDPA